MALIKQLFPISFGQGIDTKVDPKQQVLGKLRAAQNVVFETIKSARKRNGYNSIALKDTADAQISSPVALSRFLNELNLFTSNALYAFSQTLGRMKLRGSVHSIMPTSLPIYRDATTQDQIDSDFSENFRLFAWRNSSNEIRYSVVDHLSGNFLVNNALVAASASNPKIVVLQNYVYVLYLSGTNLRYRRFNILEPSTLESAVTLAANADNGTPRLDARTGSGRIVVAYNSTDVAKLKLFGINPDQTTTSVLSFSETASNALDITFDNNNRVLLTIADNTAVKFAIIPGNLTSAILSPTTIESIANVSAATTIETSLGNYKVFYGISNATPSNYLVKQNTCTFGGTVGTASVFRRSVGLASKAFRQSGGQYLVLSFESALQCTYFLSTVDGQIVCKISANVAGPQLTGRVLPKVSPVGTNNRLFASQIKSRFVSENGTFFSSLGVNSTLLNFTSPYPFRTALMANNLHVAGGFLSMYDGESVVEHGFHVFPETLAAGSSATTGGNMSDGNYGYIAVYAWTDNQGQIHRSAPSADLSVILSGGTGTQTQTINVPTLRITGKTNAIIELYRTEDSGDLYYKVTSTTSPVLNDPTVDSVSIVDTLSDATLISNEPLYTTGGVLENIAAPSCSLTCTHPTSRRVFLAGLEDPNLVQYSKVRFEGAPVEFNDALRLYVDPIGGPVTAIEAMDDKVIIFEQTAIQYIAGSGPNNLGEQDTFTEPELIASDVGCVDPRSVVLIPSGLMFKSQKGIYLLTRGLALQYIGQDVEGFNDLTITSAKIIADKNQVRFTTADNQCLVYNYNLNLWGTFTNHWALSAEVVNNVYYVLRSSTELFQENNTSFSDNGIPIKMALETGWLSLGELQGFGRVYKLLILGTYKSPHKLRVSFAYNFVDAYTQSVLIDPLEWINATAYGEASPYGTGTYGGAENVYQARVDLAQQKCQSIKILIEELEESAGEGSSFSVMTLQLGGKEGVFKVPAAQKFGSS